MDNRRWQALDQEQIRLQQELNHLNTYLQLHAGDYQKIRQKFQITGLSELRAEMITADETLLEYFVGDSNIYVVVVGQKLAIHQIPKDFPLEEWVSQLYTVLSKAPISVSYGKQVKEYAHIASQLYRKLIQPVSACILSNKLTIVPDGVLCYLSFDVLLTDRPNRIYRLHDYPYLLQKHAIRYAYSATILQLMEEKTHRIPPLPADVFLGIAPAFSGSATCDQLEPLHFNQEEVIRISRQLGGRLALGDDATKEVIQNRASKFRILHFSTHAQVNRKNGDRSSLSLHCTGDAETASLYTSEVYGLQLNADMVVLSACETASGTLLRGDGITGLSRGFTHAGAKSIVSSNWKVDEESSLYLMTSFYEKLMNGSDKSIALQAAKLKYLNPDETPNSNIFAFPYYWAAFIIIGDNQALF